jgi:hypothetical protein
MESFTEEDRKKIFLSELHLLVEEDYITGKQFNEIARAHHRYYSDLQMEAEINLEGEGEGEKKQKAVVATTPNLIKKKQVKKQEKKKLTFEEIRERNITWSLNLGVILLLIGGLFVATSNWATMSNWMKSGLIGLVSLLFFGISYLSNTVLKIKKTGLAFIILGSLFLPIFFLSIGWFKLLGDYLSFSGEGRFLFGFICCLTLVPIYITLARKLSNRLFVWFSYLAITAAIAFLIASFKLSRDWFYFGFMLYNVFTVILFHQLKKREAFKLFTKELILFAQIQLILSSLLTMVFYQNDLVNGINILITASVYLAMVYVSGRKEYHFIFSVMIVYGFYQLIEHSLLQSFNQVLFVLVGIGFLALPKFLDEQYQWKKIFELTSAVVSLLAFIYISFDAFLTNMMLENPSWALILSYLLLAGQFIYLANVMRVVLFQYLSPIFFAASLYEIIQFIDKALGLDDLTLLVFFIGFVLYISFGFLLRRIPLLRVIGNSSRDVGIVIMCVVILNSFVLSDWAKFGFMLILLSFILYLSLTIEERKVYLLVVPWLLPISHAIAFSAFGEACRQISAFYHLNLGISTNSILGSAVAFLAFFGWKSAKQAALSRNSFLIAQIFYTISILLALTFHVNEMWVRPLILLGGIGVYVSFYLVHKYKWIPYCIGLTVLISYFTILQSIYLKFQVPTGVIYLENTIAGALLLLLSFLLKRISLPVANGLAWIGHIYLPFALMFSFFIFGEKTVWSFLLAVFLYVTSAYMVRSDWKIKTFLYSGFTMFYLFITAGILDFHVKLEHQYAFLITSICITGYWLFASTNFKNMTRYYLVPYSIIGIAAFIGVYPYYLTLYLVTVLYSIGLILYLTKINWNVMTVIPLLLIFGASMNYLQSASYPLQGKLAFAALIGVGLLIIGKLVYKTIYQQDDKGAIIQFDGYTVTAFLYFGASYLYLSEQTWTHPIPGLLISIGLWLQKKRVPEGWSMWLKLVAGIYLLQPYYSTMLSLSIPDLFFREVLVLPWVVVVIYLQRCLKGNYKKITGGIQWAILIIVSLALIQDGLASNTIYDALILGTLSLLSMLAGMFLKLKSYFLVGSGVLLLNVFLQTRPLWGNLPWWAYLLITGSILISVASYNEWHKQKIAKGESTALTVLKEKIVLWFKKWD